MNYMMTWFQNFFQIGPVPDNIMTGEYNLYLVLLSYIIASLASYVALDMSTHLRRPTTPFFRFAWLAGGAFVMGAGIWSMHFVGMLAFIMPMPMTYDLFWTGLSMLVAIVAAALAFLFFMIKNPSPLQYLMSGILLGSAIPTMHYTGMAGMENVHIHYWPGLFALSILIAIVAACAALLFAVTSDRGSFAQRTQRKIISGLIMGLAISGMHYMGMAAAVITPSETGTAGQFSLDPRLMAIFITTIVISIMAIALILSMSKYYITTALKNEKDFLEVVLNNIRAGVIACDAKGNLTLINKTIKDLFGRTTTPGHFENWFKLHPFFEVNNQKMLKLSDNPLSLALNGNTIRDRELAIRDKDNIERIFVVNGQFLSSMTGEKIGAVIVCHDITARKEAELALQHEINEKEIAQERLDILNRQLIDTARRAGMAEIATSVLHNIGNVMNSVNVSTLSLREQLNATQLSGLSEIAKLIRDHEQDLNQFLTNDEQGKNFVEYISKISDFWEKRKHIFKNELDSITKYVQNINDIIMAQQSLSQSMGIIENIPLVDIIEDALSLNQRIFPKIEVKIIREYNIKPTIFSDRSKLLQVFVNLIRNIYDIFLENEKYERVIIIQINKIDDNTVSIKIIDKGKGIEAKNLIKIFSYGFTTKKKGHGIGLHTSALTIRELGGSLTAESAGLEQGSTFIIILPLKKSNEGRKEI